MKPKMVYCSDQADIVSIEAGLNAHKTTPAVEKIIDIQGNSDLKQQKH